MMLNFYQRNIQYTQFKVHDFVNNFIKNFKTATVYVFYFILIISFFYWERAFLQPRGYIGNYLSKIIEIIIVSIITIWLLNMLKTKVWVKYTEAKHKHPPQLLVYLSNFLILFSSTFYIAQKIIGIDMITLIAPLGIAAGGIVIALKEIVLSVFSGLVIALEDLYRIGERVKIGDVVEGKINKIGIRKTTIINDNNELVYVSNHKMIDISAVNFNRSQKYFFDCIEFKIPRKIIVDDIYTLFVKENIFNSLVDHKFYAYKMDDIDITLKLEIRAKKEGDMIAARNLSIKTVNDILNNSVLN